MQSLKENIQGRRKTSISHNNKDMSIISEDGQKIMWHDRVVILRRSGPGKGKLEGGKHSLVSDSKYHEIYFNIFSLYYYQNL